MDSKPVPAQLAEADVHNLHNALNADGEELYRVFQVTAPAVLRVALKNPRLTEDHLLVLLKRRDLPEDLLRALSQLKQVKQSHRLKVALARHPGTAGPLLITLLSQLYLFELVDLCTVAGATSDRKVAAERAIIQRIHATELGDKLTLARRGSASVVSVLLQEGDTRVLELCLANSRLQEVAVLQFLNGPRATAETISAIARHPRWKNRPAIRLAILRNRETPRIWFLLFLPALPSRELNQLLATRRLSVHQKKLVEDALRQRSLLTE